MARFLAGLLAATLVASAGRCWSNDTSRQISEDALRTISAQMYSGILSQEMHAGTPLPAKPHREWFQKALRGNEAALIADGYTIVPDVTESNSQWTRSEMAFDAKRRLGMPRQFGCLDAYWLDDNPDW